MRPGVTQQPARARTLYVHIFEFCIRLHSKPAFWQQQVEQHNLTLLPTIMGQHYGRSKHYVQA